MSRSSMANPGLTPDEDDLETQTAQDDALISKLLNFNPADTELAASGLNFDPNAESMADQEEKAEDAVDFGDISDDDLAEEEDDGDGDNRVKREDDEEDDFLASLQAEGAPTGEDADADGDAIMDSDLFGEGDVDGWGDNDHDMNAKTAPTPPAGDVDIKPELESPVLQRAGLEPTPPDFTMDEPMFEAPKTKEDFIREAQELFPGFAPNKRLRFNSFLPPKLAHWTPKLLKEPKRLLPTKPALLPAPETEKYWRSATLPLPAEYGGGKAIVQYITERERRGGEDGEEDHEDEDEDEPPKKKLDLDLQLACQDWEDVADLPVEDEDVEMEYGKQDRVDLADERPSKRIKLLPRYVDELPSSWPNLLDELPADAFSRIELNLNDPDLLVEKIDAKEVNKARRIGKEFRRLGNRGKQDFLHQRYNLSNDEAYDALKENHQNKVRSTLAELEVIHAMPALRLQTPFYKTRLSVKEKRSFHRPQMHFHPGAVIRFNKIKLRKKKTYKNQNPQDILKTTADMSLSDGTNFVLFEYSEEHPTVISNFGMGSRIINYYRKKDPSDDARPKLELGEVQVLMQQDRSPFWNFGFVDAGETVPALCNKMTRAPIFKHNPKSTDFLVIRNTCASNGTKYYIRTIPHLFVVGQVFPAMDVPGPHSRKVTNASRNRLKMVCYRVLKRKDEKAIAVKDISEHFPENNDMQSRQKMKEFMSYHKEKGLWEMKPGEQVPDEAALRALVTPETVCLLDTMQVGVQHLEDAGFGKGLDIDEDVGDKEEGSIEQQMAPWVITRNFIEATQGKAMLKLYGEGDPSGRGEAFSFIRTSMKGGFKAIGESVEEKMDKQRLKELGGHSYNVAKQQKSYEESIAKIWRAQQASLSNTEERDDQDFADSRRDDPDAMDIGQTPRSEARTPGYFAGNDDELSSQFSKASGGQAGGQKHKVLKITRQVRNADGQLETQIEYVRDPKVIRQYRARRALRLSQSVPLEEFKPTGNVEQDKEKQRLLQLELDRLMNNKERRLVREKQRKKKSGAGDYGSPDVNSPMSPGGAMDGMGGKGGKATTRKCTSCGLIGHIRTNKKLCPNQNPELAAQYAEQGIQLPGPDTPATPSQS